MAGPAHEPYDDPKLQGFSRYFNNQTIKGRANVSLATLVFLFTGFTCIKVMKRKDLSNMPKSENSEISK
ncbi:unnamed protein product [Psylliodes chrysocephalus]|uniref:Up-regulated during skeletal muscle growth protein 5 n=1 Tax=Psylliodes chrysocephalus TaxID=3402493 RepID=A0A9P0CWI4_9CUCU|nr:unnamed protein product [Psylliodes chrysocephala]